MKETFTIEEGEQLEVVIEGWIIQSIKQYLAETCCMMVGDFFIE